MFIKGNKKTADGLEPNMAINYVSHHVLTEELLPVLEATSGSSQYGARIINMTSASFYCIPDLQESDMFSKRYIFERFAPYARSKLAQVLSMVELAERERGRVTVNCTEPGMVLTDIYRYDPLAGFFFKIVLAIFTPFVLLKPEEGAVTAVWMALSSDLHQVTGRVFSDLHETPLGLNVEAIHRLMPHCMAQLTAQIMKK